MNDMLPADCPAIHVTFTALADEGLFPWVKVGAEEQGVPCRLVVLQEPVDVVALAQAAAESSRLNIGVAVDRSEVLLYEAHMPPRHPVLRFRFDGRAPAACRLMGDNAARMVVRLPIRFPPAEKQRASRVETEAPQPQGQPSAMVVNETPAAVAELDPKTVARIVATAVRKLAERGIEL